MNTIPVAFVNFINKWVKPLWHFKTNKEEQKIKMDYWKNEWNNTVTVIAQLETKIEIFGRLPKEFEVTRKEVGKLGSTVATQGVTAGEVVEKSKAELKENQNIKVALEKLMGK